MSQIISRTPFFHRNQVRKRRVAMATAGVVAGITAATVFLCIRPAVVPTAVAATLPVTASAHADQPERQAMHEGRAAAAAVAMASGAMVTLADRHASDAVRLADASASDSADDLDWDYVQLRM
ncbi:hypothetical protein [Cupriavidus sp. BIS7]|uniref:hypothetical protein n=1 Tax=Cupriavidus sp. BIS7 TaxID=1217718 RepID=UPI0002F1979E|nr:hypothetical protein [Cupriavidus sp. BIS7]